MLTGRTFDCGFICLKIHSENEKLQKEVAQLRHKSRQQEHVLNKV